MNLCALLLTLVMAGYPHRTEAVCVTPAVAEAKGLSHAAGWYNGDEDKVYVVYSPQVSPDYVLAVLAHELVHADDLRIGTLVNGYPSFYSQTNTTYDIEHYARLVTHINGSWAINETFPDALPTAHETAHFRALGVLPSWSTKES